MSVKFVVVSLDLCFATRHTLDMMGIFGQTWGKTENQDQISLCYLQGLAQHSRITAQEWGV